MRLVVAFRAAASVGVMCLLIALVASAARRAPLPPPEEMPPFGAEGSRSGRSSLIEVRVGGNRYDQWLEQRVEYRVTVSERWLPENEWLVCHHVCRNLTQHRDHSQCDFSCDEQHTGRDPDALNLPHARRRAGELIGASEAGRDLTLDRGDEITRELREGRARGRITGSYSFERDRNHPVVSLFNEFQQWATQEVTASMDHAADPCTRKTGRLKLVMYFLWVTLHFDRGGRLGGAADDALEQERDVWLAPEHQRLLATATRLSREVQELSPEEICGCGPVGKRTPTGGGRKASRLKDEDFDALPPALSKLNDAGSTPISLVGAGLPATSVVQRVLTERVAIGWPDAASRGGVRLVARVAGGGWARWLTLPMANDGGVAHAADQGVGELALSLVATGRASGEVFRLEVLDAGNEAPELVAPDGLVLEPIDPRSLRGASVPAGKATERHPVVGYCLDFVKPPPAAGMLYRVAPRAVQEQFRPLRAVLRAGRQLADAGRLHPDSNPQTYAEFVRQWAVWTQVEQWDAQEFTEKFVARTKENAERSKQRWTPSMAQQLRAAAPNRWRDIRQVLDEATALVRAPTPRASPRE